LDLTLTGLKGIKGDQGISGGPGPAGAPGRTGNKGINGEPNYNGYGRPGTIGQKVPITGVESLSRVQCSPIRTYW